MTTRTGVPSGEVARDRIQLDAEQRHHRCEVARWALANGRPLNIDAITVILAARHAEAAIERRAPTRWTTRTVLTFFFGSVEQWCTEAGVRLPDHLGESLHTYLLFLDAHGSLAKGSSTITELSSSVRHISGLSAAGFATSQSVKSVVVEPTRLPIRARRR